MHFLMMGSQGEDVRRLQHTLHRYEPGLAVDGIFGPRTEQAVRLAQRRLTLYPPDGIVGPLTLAALGPTNGAAPRHHGHQHRATQHHARSHNHSSGKGDPGALRPVVEPARHRAEKGQMPPGTVSPVASMRVSRDGRHFIIGHESLRGVSNRLHHPSLGSGVTIGPGYDMKDRSVKEIEADLAIINVPPAAAAQAAQGAGKSGTAAETFVRENKQVLNISPTQESALLDRIVGHYERMVQRAITIPLHQYEFDALVSYAYNPGGGWRKATDLVNARKPDEAMIEIGHHVFSRHQLVHSLVVRRHAETRMFLYGEYR